MPLHQFYSMNNCLKSNKMLICFLHIQFSFQSRVYSKMQSSQKHFWQDRQSSFFYDPIFIRQHKNKFPIGTQFKLNSEDGSAKVVIAFKNKRNWVLNSMSLPRLGTLFFVIRFVPLKLWLHLRLLVLFIACG